MAEAFEIQALEKISSEVDESQIKVILSTQCIKAQSFLVDKLRKQAERSKERCSFISGANFRVQSEITQAQQEIKSSLISKETIKMANVELKKEWLLAKDKKLDVIERVANGEKRYEALWNESKARYESLPFVQKLIKAKNEVLNLEQQIKKLENDKETLFEEFEVQKETCRIIDSKRIIEMAEFMVNEMPKSVDIINKKSTSVRGLTKELEKLDFKAKADIAKKEAAPATVDASISDTAWPLVQNFEDNTLFMPKLQLSLLDFDTLSVKLDQVKIKRVDSFNKTPEKISTIDVDANKVDRKIESTEEYISSFFNKPSAYEENKPQNYARMKLINILENVKIDTDRAQEMVSKVNPDSLLPVQSISVEVKKAQTNSSVVKTKDTKPLVSQEIEEIDLTVSNTETLLIPPTQFLDMALEMQVSQKELKEHEESLVTESTSKEGNLPRAYMSSQEGVNKKTVSFDLPTTLDNNVESGVKSPEIALEIDANETINTQLDVSDEGFANKIEDMIIKKHHLDLSPQFVYTKNNIGPLNLQKNDDVITSKFFQQNQKPYKDNILEVHANIVDNQMQEAIDKGTTNVADNPANQTKKEKYSAKTDIGGDMVTSPKRQKIHETQSHTPVSGFMFGHGSVMTAESMNVSISTAGFEDGDPDYPQCLDSSLLLSPKADIPMPVTGDSQEVLSQDVPNFLSGLRKTGFSFFGGMPSSEPKPESSAQNQAGGFSFNFGGEDKKTRGGFFSMFK